MRKTLSAVAAGAAFFPLALTAFAAGSPTLFGDATSLGGGTVQLRSDADPGYGGMDFSVADDLTFAEFESLSTEFNATDDGCAGGSPRFQINLDTDNDGDADGNIFSYLGTYPSYTCSLDTWENSGDLLETGRYLDTSQLTGGTFYDTYDAALTKYGSGTVLGVQLVVDSGWAFADGEQTVLVRNTVLDGQVTSADQCKKGGWEALGYRNQGQCISAKNR